MPAAHMKIYRGEPVDNRIAENVKIGNGKAGSNLKCETSFTNVFFRCRGPADPGGEHRQPEHLRHAHLRVHGQGRPRVVRAETDQRRGVSLAWLGFTFGFWRSPAGYFVALFAHLCHSNQSHLFVPLSLNAPPLFFSLRRCPVEYEIMGEFEYSSSKTTALVHFQVILMSTRRDVLVLELLFFKGRFRIMRYIS